MGNNKQDESKNYPPTGGHEEGFIVVVESAMGKELGVIPVKKCQGKGEMYVMPEGESAIGEELGDIFVQRLADRQELSVKEHKELDESFPQTGGHELTEVLIHKDLTDGIELGIINIKDINSGENVGYAHLKEFTGRGSFDKII